MAFFCKDAGEEALKEIARQMRLTNAFEVLQELHKMQAMTDTEYKYELRKIFDGI